MLFSDRVAAGALWVKMQCNYIHNLGSIFRKTFVSGRHRCCRWSHHWRTRVRPVDTLKVRLVDTTRTAVNIHINGMFTNETTAQVMKETDKLCFHRPDFSSCFRNASGAGNADCLIPMSAAILNMTTYQYE